MKLANLLIVGLSLTVVSVSADVFEAWDFQVINGDVQKNIAIFDSAKKIHERLGGTVEYWQHDVAGSNVVGYIIRFKNVSEWANFKDVMVEDTEWNQWLANNWPRLQPHLIASFAMGNVLDPTANINILDGQNVIYMTAWQPRDNSNTPELASSIQRSVAIGRQNGLNVNVYAGGPDGVFYIFESAENFSSLVVKQNKRNASEEWQTYWTKAQQERKGELVKQAFITRIH